MRVVHPLHSAYPLKAETQPRWAWIGIVVVYLWHSSFKFLTSGAIEFEYVTLNTVVKR